MVNQSGKKVPGKVRYQARRSEGRRKEAAPAEQSSMLQSEVRDGMPLPTFKLYSWWHVVCVGLENENKHERTITTTGTTADTD